MDADPTLHPPLDLPALGKLEPTRQDLHLEDLHRWRMEILKEGTTAAIALSVIATYLWAVLHLIDSPALVNLVILIVGFYFGAKTLQPNFRRQHRASDNLPKPPVKP